MADIRKNERLLNLVSFLLKVGRPVPWDVIRRDVDGYNSPRESEAAAARRFARDKTALRAMGVPLEYVTDDACGGRGYQIPTGSYFLPRLDLTPQEVTALAFVARAAQAGASAPAAAALGTALQKLQFDSPIPGDVRATVEERYLFYHPEAPAAASAAERARLETLTSAALESRTARFAYPTAQAGAAKEESGSSRVGRLKRHSDEGLASFSPREVDPYGLAYWRGHWYMVGRCHMRDAVRSFRLDRIRGAVTVCYPEGAPGFEPPADFRVEDYIGRPPWELTRGAPVQVTIRFDATVAWMVKQTRQPGDRWLADADGRARLERTVGDPEALLRWLLRFSAHAELLAPTELRLRLAEELRAVRALYARKGAANG
jgi:predicted DNA-binding transcriptional regulator YafY